MGLAYKSVTGDPSFLVPNDWVSSPFDNQSILMKDHFMGTAKLFETSIVFLHSRTRMPLIH